MLRLLKLLSQSPYACGLVGLLLVPVGNAVAAEASKGTVEGVAFFEERIRPVLVRHCYECHSSESKSVKGGLLLDTREGIRRGGQTAAAVVPNDADKSLILKALRHEELEMPPTRKLPGRIIGDFQKWITMGAPDPRDGSSTISEAKAIDMAAGREFWSFQKPIRHDAPTVSDASWSRSRIDPFVLARLDAAKLKPNPGADRRTLIRRLYLTVLGLPPTVDQVDRFVQDKSEGAWERVVDEVLASPHYGERLARLWLDVSRYAEDQAHIVGSNKSLFYPNAYRYRDWVIQALNDDLPYDQFVKLQLAADLMGKDVKDQVSLGFVGLGPKYYRRNDPEVMADEWENHIDTVGRGLLGLTIACARCHDHKYDPVSTEDYYGLAGVFASTQLYNYVPPKKKSEDDKKKSNKKSKKDKSKEVASNALHLVRDAKPRDVAVQIRGNVKTPGNVIPRAFLTVLSPDGKIPLDEGSGRLQLAQAIVSRENPLAARVIVNRVWALLVGRGLVNTPSNFGILGSPPSHPKLLDDLSVRFMDAGWSLKWLYREVLLSATWGQASDLRDDGMGTDPDNELLWRMNRRRMDIETWRDTILLVAGRLDSTVGGKSIDPIDPKQARRTVYARISRLDLNPMLAMFDFPDPNAHAAYRAETTTPLQKMFVMNSPFMVHQASALTKLAIESANEADVRVRWLIRRVFGRDVSEDEVTAALSYLGANDDEQVDRWEQFAQVLLASNETLFVD